MIALIGASLLLFEYDCYYSRMISFDLSISVSDSLWLIGGVEDGGEGADLHTAGVLLIEVVGTLCVSQFY